jgi:hypothetical protein
MSATSWLASAGTEARPTEGLLGCHIGAGVSARWPASAATEDRPTEPRIEHKHAPETCTR